MKRILDASFLEGHERERYQHGQALEMETKVKAMELELHLATVPGYGFTTAANISLSQMAALQLWAFLDQATSRLAAGNKEIFYKQDGPDGLEDILSDAVDRAFEVADVPNFLPVLSIMRFIHARLNQREIYEEGLNNSWTKTEISLFLYTYFQWWNDGGGDGIVEALIKDGEERVERHKGEAKVYFSLVNGCGEKMVEFQEFLKKNSLP